MEPIIVRTLQTTVCCDSVYDVSLCIRESDAATWFEVKDTNDLTGEGDFSFPIDIYDALELLVSSQNRRKGKMKDVS